MVTDDETPVAAGETGGQGDELAGGRAPPDADSPADLDAIVSGALTDPPVRYRILATCETIWSNAG